VSAGKIVTMEPSESITKNVAISCGVLLLTALLIVSVFLAGAALLLVLRG
jgi:hypothetical protein